MKWKFMGKGQEDSTILEIINHTFIGGQACTIDLCIGVLYGCHLLVRYWRISDEYLCFCYCIFGGLKRYLHQRYPRRCKPHQWKMLAHLPPGLPGKPSINWNSVRCMQCFLLIVGSCMVASGSPLPSWHRSLQSPRTFQGNGLQMCEVQQWLIFKLFWWKTFGKH